MPHVPRFLFAPADAYAGVEVARSHQSQTLGVLLPALVAAFRVRTVIEIGICEAFTTRVLAQSLAALCPGEGVLLSCDSDPEACARGREACAGLACRVEILPVASEEVDWREALRKAGRIRADLALVDGSHEFEDVRADLDATSAVLRLGGLLLAHDYDPKWPGVWGAVNEFTFDRDWPLVVVPYDPETGSTPVAVFQRPEFEEETT